MVQLIWDRVAQPSRVQQVIFSTFLATCRPGASALAFSEAKKSADEVVVG